MDIYERAKVLLQNLYESRKNDYIVLNPNDSELIHESTYSCVKIQEDLDNLRELFDIIIEYNVIIEKIREGEDNE